MLRKIKNWILGILGVVVLAAGGAAALPDQVPERLKVKAPPGQIIQEEFQADHIRYYWYENEIPAFPNENFSRRTEDTVYFEKSKRNNGTEFVTIRRYLSPVFYRTGNKWHELMTATTTPEVYERETGRKITSWFSETAFGATATSSNDIDTQVYKDQPTWNYGAGTDLNIRETSGAGGPLRTLVRFTMMENQCGTVTDVKLVLTKTTNLAALGTVNAHQLTQTGWTEGTGNGSATGDGATWNTYNGSTNWTTAGGDFSATVIDANPDPNNVGDLLTIPLMGTAATNPLTLDWEDQVDIILKQSNESLSTDTGGIYASQEHGTASNRPYFEVTYTPGACPPSAAARRAIIIQ